MRGARWHRTIDSSFCNTALMPAAKICTAPPMLLAYVRYQHRILLRLGGMLPHRLPDLSHNHHVESSLPMFRANSTRCSCRTAAGYYCIKKHRASSPVTRSTSSQQAEYSVFSYSSAEPYTPQQLAELREDARDTIVALSSGSGRAGVAVIRVSGPRAGEANAQGMRLWYLTHLTIYAYWIASNVQMMSCKRS